MKKKYEFKEIEKKWQNIWEDSDSFAAPEDIDKKKYYVLEMFPYPSGKLHMGHVRNYSIGDVVARTKIMKGYNVLHPIGYDAFGLPAENAAIKNGAEPSKWTHENMEEMTKQLKELGLSYDWKRRIATCDPEYYKWMQWIFIEFFNKKITYKKENPINFYPDCQTNYYKTINRNFRSNTTANLSTLKNKVLALGDNVQPITAGMYFDFFCFHKRFLLACPYAGFFVQAYGDIWNNNLKEYLIV